MDAKVAKPIPVPSSSTASPKHKYAERRQRHPNNGRNESNTIPEQSGSTNRVIVKGYPVFTQATDLVRVLGRFGKVKLETLKAKSAILTFSSQEEAQAAVNGNSSLIIYGQYITIRPFNGLLPHETRHAQKKQQAKDKQMDIIVDPTTIDYSGDFYEQLDKVLSEVRLTQDNIKALGSLYTDVENAMNQQWPGCTAMPFGSITTGLGVKSSDADCFVDIPQQFRMGNPNFVHKAKRILQQNPDKFKDILSIPRANTPIVKFLHIPTSTNCDLSFKSPLGVQNSKLIAFLLQADARLLPVAVIIKYWARVQGFSGSGRVTNYALIMMLLFYLQQTSVGFLPSVESLQRDKEVIIDFWNTGFKNQPLPPSDSKLAISELLGGFFEFYAMFNFEDMVICPYLGVPIKKEVFKDLNQLPSAFERYKKNVESNYVMPMRFSSPMCIQDPFEQCHNVASTVSVRLVADVIAHFKFACSIYEKEKIINCENLLKSLFLLKPKLQRIKTNPDFRVNLFPRIISTIINPDWKTVVRDLIFAIFEEILKVKLGKMEEKICPDTKKEKEKYSAAFTKPLWKRKQYSRYVHCNLGFKKRQESITEEIIKREEESIDVKFQLTIMYSHDPKSSVISIRFGAGDAEAFKEFGKFFISYMQRWFLELLKPLAKKRGNMGEKIAETLNVLDNDVESQVIFSDDDDPQ